MSLQISIRVTVPEVVLNSQLVRSMIVNQMQRKSAPDVIKLFKSTTEGWKDRPNFLQKFTNSPTRVSAEIWPGQNTKMGKIYTYINNGTPDRRIRPRKARMLRFQPGYRAATRPRVLGSRPAQRFGDYVSSGEVKHHSIEAREFDAEIVEQYADTFVEDMQEVIRVAVVRRS